MTEEIIWSVGLVIDDAESRALYESSVAGYIMEATEGHVIRFTSPPLVEAEEIENLRLEVAASSAQAAEERALGIVYRARRAAGLPDRVIPVAWVALQDALESGENYLDQAEDLFEGESYGLAIVAAEIHLESQAKAMIEAAVKRDASSFEGVLFEHPNNFKLRHSAGQKMIRRFLGINLTQLPEWQDLRAHHGRRDEVAHRGKEFGEEEASKSIEVVRKIWLQLAEAARQVEETGGLVPQD